MSDNVTLTLIGGPTLLLEFAGLRLLTDPTFDEPGSYQGGVVLTKLTRPALSFDALKPIDAVLLSHDQHFDNLDHAGRAMLPEAGHVLTTQAGAARLGPHATGLAPWESITLPGSDGRVLRVTAVPARHGPVGIEPISGDVIGFILQADGGRAIYISGDTVWYEGVADVAKRFEVGIAILFTGSAQPRGAFHVTMDSNDAIEATYAFGKAAIVAVHNEGWEHFTQSQEDLRKAFAKLGIGDRLHMLQKGIATTLRL